MMGERAAAQEELFYGFNLEQHVPANHPVRHPQTPGAVFTAR